MSTHDTEYKRTLLKTRWAQLDRAKTDHRRGKPVPAMQKPCSGTKIALPDPSSAATAGVAVGDAIRGRASRRKFADAPLNLEELSFLLWATQGVRKHTEKASFRTVPSGGARHPFETYLFCSRVEGIEPGLYRYLPFDHALCSHGPIERMDEVLEEALLKHHFGAAVDFVWAAVPYRCEWTYGSESLRLILLDAGHVCGQLYLACEEVGCGTCAVGAYDQDKLDGLLGLDGHDEFAVYAAPVGKRPGRETID
ncbi:MAG: SagB/ThcOx family dehydrogenase [Spirochaetes bacterium]|jgi:SagB-type dehydrogenase family enzyme|nr:SagB/ThcOx family dehydrogenase [Spirochaetota bacterium]